MISSSIIIPASYLVIPAQAGIQLLPPAANSWTPAFAGVTGFDFGGAL